MTNVLFIMSDEHSKRVAGFHGNGIVNTPTLDALAERGTVYDAAYTNCPICVPARATFATGRYVHDIGNWDNAFPYDGTPAIVGPPAARGGRAVRLHRQAALPHGG